MSQGPVTRERVDALERELAVKRSELATLERSLETARERRADLVDLLGEGVDFIPLPVAPLIAAVGSNLLAVTALWFAYVAIVFLDGWTLAVCSGALVLAAPLELLASRRGAGGSARALVRRVTWIVAALAVIALAVATVRVVADAHRLRF
jgi:hypothetical protein